MVGRIRRIRVLNSKRIPLLFPFSLLISALFLPNLTAL